MTPRAILYLRQSVSREDSISLELQETAGRKYCAQMGYAVVGVESDPGISGRTFKRPAVTRTMAAVENHEAEVIVLWKWSRLSRSRFDWAIAAERIMKAGGRIESATEQLDTTTSTGRLARGMMTEFAAFESERIGDVWKEAHARRVKQGLPATGRPRFGYEYSREAGFTPDPITGPALASMYRSYLSGISIYTLTKTLNDSDVRPVRGYGPTGDGLWSDHTIRRVLDSGFGAGFITFKKELHPGIHQPVITVEEWEAYRVAREARRTHPRTERSEYLLSGLVRCVCGSRMQAGLSGSDGRAKYRCKNGKEKRIHPGGYVQAAIVEAAVFDWLKAREVRLNQETAKAPTVKVPTIDPARFEKQLADIDRRIDALGMRLVDSSIPLESYERLLTVLKGNRQTVESAQLAARVNGRQVEARMPAQILDRWEEIPIPERRELIRTLIDYVEVTTGRPGATMRVVPRVL